MRQVRSRCHGCPLRRRKGANDGPCRMCDKSDMTDKELKEEQARLEKLFTRKGGRNVKNDL